LNQYFKSLPTKKKYLEGSFNNDIDSVNIRIFN